MERGKLVMSGTIAELGQKMTARRMSVKWRADGDKALANFEKCGVKNLETAAHGATFDFDGGNGFCWAPA